jgi:ubiquinone/menaquinone biosynthesis C-methylase UbiE
MTESYVSDGEYQDYFQKLDGLRQRVAGDLPLASGMWVLDLATGSGYFALALVERHRGMHLVGIDVVGDGLRRARENMRRRGLSHGVKMVQMDASRMAFGEGRFDAVVNFLGLEDIHMTSGREGVQRTFLEASRVVKPGGSFCFVAMPPDEMETQAQGLEVALYSYICGATWLSVDEYEHMLNAGKLLLMGKKKYCTGKKLTPEQAKTEIKFACGQVPKIYGIQTPSFEDTWRKFGKDIERYGLGHYSRVVSFCARKVVDGP